MAARVFQAEYQRGVRCGERKEERGGGRVRRVGEKDTQESAECSLGSLAEYSPEHFVTKLLRETTTQKQRK